MSNSPYNLSDQKENYSSRFYPTNYDYSIPNNTYSNNYNSINNKISIPLNFQTNKNNIHDHNTLSMSDRNGSNSMSNKTQPNSNLNVLNKVDLNGIQSQIMRVKKNASISNLKSNQLRVLSNQYKQNDPYFRNTQINNQNQQNHLNYPPHPPTHILSPKNSLNEKFTFKNPDSQQIRPDDYYNHPTLQKKIPLNLRQSKQIPQQSNNEYHCLSNREKSSINLKKDAINEVYKVEFKNTDSQRNFNQKQRQNLLNGGVDNSLCQNNGIGGSRIRKNCHRKSKSIEFTFDEYTSIQSIQSKIRQMQNMIKSNTTNLHEHKKKIQKLQNNSQQQQQILNSSTKNDLINTNENLHKSNHKHSRTNSSSSMNNYRQLSDIMSLIQESKNFQIKNSQEYRKMIEEFRTTILQFRDELNKTVKKNDFEDEIKKIKQNSSNFNLSKEVSKTQYIQQNNNNRETYTSKSKQTQNYLNSITKTISDLKSTISKIEDSNLSLKAQIVKLNVRDKKASEENITKFTEFDKKIIKIENSMSIFDERNWRKTDKKYQGNSICFSVNNQVHKQKKNNFPLAHRRSNSTSQESPKLSFSHSRSPSHLNEYQTYTQSPQLLSKRIDIKNNMISKRIYYIDPEGYLLDKDNYYLVNHKNEPIKLSQNEIALLKKANIIQSNKNSQMMVETI